MLRYYITDRKSCGGDVLPHIRRAIADGVDYIQIREKDLPARSLLELARTAVWLTKKNMRTAILVNGRADIALAAGAHGVHLPGNSLPPSVLKPLVPFVSVSAHSIEDVERAERENADLVLFGPVFSSPGKGTGVGLDELARVCRSTNLPVFALGGVTYENAPECVQAGASGIAGIRLFQVSGNEHGASNA